MAIIRPMVPGDYTVVAAISNDAAARALVGRPAWETTAEVARTISQSRWSEFIVAEDDDGRVIGFAGYNLVADGHAELYGPLATVEGHGVGAWLSSRIETMARHHGAGSYSMLIGLANRSGATWAEWRGYQLDTEFPETQLSWVYPGELRRERLYEGGTVRRAQAADLDQIEAIYQASFQAESATRENWLRWLPGVWLLEDQVGVVHGLLHLDPEAGSIRQLCVAPAARRQGMGGRLLAEAIETCWRERPAKLGIALALDNQSAVSLTRRLGFRREIAVARWMKRDG